jgi:hypothetical protein
MPAFLPANPNDSTAPASKAVAVPARAALVPRVRAVTSLAQVEAGPRLRLRSCTGNVARSARGDAPHVRRLGQRRVHAPGHASVDAADAQSVRRASKGPTRAARDAGT